MNTVSIDTTRSAPRNLFAYRKFWASRFGSAPFLPMSRAEMDELGWDSCNIILVTGDAYICLLYTSRKRCRSACGVATLMLSPG